MSVGGSVGVGICVLALVSVFLFLVLFICWESMFVSACAYICYAFVGGCIYPVSVC